MSEMRAEGKEVRVTLKSGEVVEAELIAVRDDALLLTRQIRASNKRLREDSTSIEYFPRIELVQITIEGKSYVGMGAVVGLAVGITAGALIGSSSVEEEKDLVGKIITEPMGRLAGGLIGGFAGGLGGLLVGMVIGGAVSPSDEDVQPSQLARLREFARYADTEPEFLINRFRVTTAKENDE